MGKGCGLLTATEEREQRMLMIGALVENTHFVNRQEVDALLKNFKELSRGKPNLLRQEFRTMIHKCFQITDDNILDRIFRTFDSSNNAKMCQKEYVEGMSIWLRGTTTEKIKFAHMVFDLNSDSYISRDEMFNLLKDSIQNKGGADEDAEEGTKDLVDTLLRKLDRDGDGRVSLTDFSDSIMADPLLMDCLGVCLPSAQTVKIFEDQTFVNCASIN